MGEYPKLILDENIGVFVADTLSARGFDVLAVVKDMRGESDDEIIKKALDEKRVLITLDSDFGYLVFKCSEDHAGVLYLRLRNESPENIARIIMQYADYLPQIKDKFARANESHIVIR